MNKVSDQLSPTSADALTLLFVEKLDAIENAAFHKGLQWGLLLNNVVILVIYLVVKNVRW
jgi:hypothetical protein